MTASISFISRLLLWAGLLFGLMPSLPLAGQELAPQPEAGPLQPPGQAGDSIAPRGGPDDSEPADSSDLQAHAPESGPEKTDAGATEVLPAEAWWAVYNRRLFDPDDFDTFYDSGLSLDGWESYNRARVSYRNLGWCWLLPGACLYRVSGRGHTFNLVRGLAYSATFLAGAFLADKATDGSGSDRAVRSLMWVGAVGNVVDGGISFRQYNRDLREELQPRFPRQALVRNAQGWSEEKYSPRNPFPVEPPNDLDFLESGLTLDQWAAYERERVSYGHLAWCWMVPGACQYVVSNPGHTFNLVRGIVYTAVAGGGLMTVMAGGISAAITGEADRDLVYTGLALMGASAVISFTDGAFSFGAYNRGLMQELQAPMPVR